jgi:FkbM family methyltransferase
LAIAACIAHPDACHGSGEKVMASSTDDYEQQLVGDFFAGTTSGFFVDVGANHPHNGSQSWHLERRGWSGIVVEPLPDLAAQLRRARRATVFAVACSSPENAGRTLPYHVAGPLSALDDQRMVPGARRERVIAVEVRTLDQILATAAVTPPIDFLSIDVEGHEIEVLRGFDFGRWRPRLILLEDQVGNLDKYRFLRAAGYRLVRHCGFNGWYVPSACPVRLDWRDRWEVVRKYFLALPFRILRNASRRLRQPIKDRLRNRQRPAGGGPRPPWRDAA